jgi:hypothetical protein
MTQRQCVDRKITAKAALLALYVNVSSTKAGLE